MLISEQEENILNGEVVTRVYVNDNTDPSVVTFYQYVFKGGEVIGTSCVELKVKDFASVVMAVTKAEISKSSINF